MALPDTNGYITVADADTWFASSFGNAQWLALTAAEKQVAITEASRALESLHWWGEKCGTTQPWAWPRKLAASSGCGEAVCTALPGDVVSAVCQLALSLHITPTALVPALAGSTGATITTSTAGGGNGAVKRQKLGDLEQEFFAPASSSTTTSKTTSTGAQLPRVLGAFPWLSDLLRCWMVPPSTGSARVLTRGAGDGCGGGCRRLDGLPFVMPYPVGISDSSRMLPTASGMWGDYVDRVGTTGWLG